MSSFNPAAILFIAVGVLAGKDAEAQGTPPRAAAPAGMRDPGDPKAVVPPAVYTSAFKHYRPNTGAEVDTWRDLNDNVGRIGGWRVYGQEAAPATAPPDEPTGNGKAEGTSPATAPASGSDDVRFDPVAEAAKKYTGQEARSARNAVEQDSIERRVAELLAQPLTADSAVQVALLNNRGLQATYQELGIAQADLVQAVQRSVSMETLQFASEARKAFYAAVAAEQSVRYMNDAKATADAGAELARRLAQAGNINKLQQAREHGFFSEAALNLARAQQMRTATRERLARTLGLWGEQLNYTLPERLPDLPKEPADQPDIEQQALAQRLDVQSARLNAEATARHLGIGNVTYMQSVHRAANVAVDARSEVREAYDRYRSAYDIARLYRDDIVPTAKRISDENLLRYNGMLIGVFDLLADARAQIGAVASSIEALRDFWVARADLDMAMIGKPSLAPPGTGLGRAAGGGATPH